MLINIDDMSERNVVAFIEKSQDRVIKRLAQTHPVCDNHDRLRLFRRNALNAVSVNLDDRDMTREVLAAMIDRVHPTSSDPGIKHIYRGHSYGAVETAKRSLLYSLRENEVTFLASEREIGLPDGERMIFERLTVTPDRPIDKPLFLPRPHFLANKLRQELGVSEGQKCDITSKQSKRLIRELADVESPACVLLTILFLEDSDSNKVVKLLSEKELLDKFKSKGAKNVPHTSHQDAQRVITDLIYLLRGEKSQFSRVSSGNNVNNALIYIKDNLPKLPIEKIDQEMVEIEGHQALPIAIFRTMIELAYIVADPGHRKFTNDFKAFVARQYGNLVSTDIVSLYLGDPDEV